MLGGLGVPEIVIILMVVLLFFGANKIPELARGIGQGMNEFRQASDEIKKELEQGQSERFGDHKKEREHAEPGNNEEAADEAQPEADDTSTNENEERTKINKN